MDVATGRNDISDGNRVFGPVPGRRFWGEDIPANFTFMKRMPILLLLLTTFFALMTTNSFGQGDQQLSVEVVFTGGMSKAEVDRLSQQTFPNVQWRASAIRWDVDGGLRGINLAVRTEKGEGTAQSDDLLPGERFGFRYDPRPGVKVPFSIGSLDRGDH